MDQDNQNQPDLLTAFCREILGESGMLPEDSAEYRRVMESVLDRVTARVFLELIAGLSPEQAKRVAGDLSKGNPEPAATIQALSKEVPDLALRIAQALTRMRGELLTDIGEIVKANGK